MIWSTFGRRLVALPGISSLYSLLVAAGLVREKLTANRTYYVRTDGSDSNTGLVDSAGGAFLTVQKAINVVAALDISIYNVTIQVKTGTYTGQCTVNGPWLGSGTVTILGDTGTPANVTLQTTTSTLGVVRAQNGGRITISGITLVASGGGVGMGLNAATNGIITIGAGVVFGACNTYHMAIEAGGSIGLVNGAYTIAGSTQVHIQCQSGGIVAINANTITITGTPAFSSRFITATRLGMVEYYSNTFVGSATGSRYSASSNSVIFVNGGGASYLPGDSAGATSTGGQYL